MAANLEAKTGKSLEAWAKVAQASGEQTHGKMVAHLKSAHGLTHGYANLVAHTALGSAAQHQQEAGVDLVAEQYSGAKAGLKPIYDALVKEVESLGKDVEFAPKKAYVSLRRKKQFGLIQPSTATRVDLGLNLKGVEPEGKLEPAGSWNTMCTHRIKLGSAAEVSSEVKKWLRAAYEGA